MTTSGWNKVKAILRHHTWIPKLQHILWSLKYLIFITDSILRSCMCALCIPRIYWVYTSRTRLYNPTRYFMHIHISIREYSQRTLLIQVKHQPEYNDHILWYVRKLPQMAYIVILGSCYILFLVHTSYVQSLYIDSQYVCVFWYRSSVLSGSKNKLFWAITLDFGFEENLFKIATNYCKAYLYQILYFKVVSDTHKSLKIITVCLILVKYWKLT